MEINSFLNTSGIFDLDAVESVDSSKRYRKLQEQTTPSGDTVDISDEAKKLYSEMIHKYDGASRSSQEEQGCSEKGDGGAGGLSQGGSSSSSSADSVESIKKQIESLKSQLSALASQASSGKGGEAATSKMNALQSQIAALEAQLNAMEAAA